MFVKASKGEAMCKTFGRMWTFLLRTSAKPEADAAKANKRTEVTLLIMVTTTTTTTMKTR
jgi:hypothetical protein